MSCLRAINLTRDHSACMATWPAVGTGQWPLGTDSAQFTVYRLRHSCPTARTAARPIPEGMTIFCLVSFTTGAVRSTVPATARFLVILVFKQKLRECVDREISFYVGLERGCVLTHEMRRTRLKKTVEWAWPSVTLKPGTHCPYIRPVCTGRIYGPYIRAVCRPLPGVTVTASLLWPAHMHARSSSNSLKRVRGSTMNHTVV